MSFVSSAGHRTIRRARLVASGLLAVTVSLVALAGVGQAATSPTSCGCRSRSHPEPRRQ
jgi:hypothetical protein